MPHIIPMPATHRITFDPHTDFKNAIRASSRRFARAKRGTLEDKLAGEELERLHLRTSFPKGAGLEKFIAEEFMRAIVEHTNEQRSTGAGAAGKDARNGI